MKKRIIILIFILLTLFFMYTSIPEIFPNSIVNFITSMKKEFLQKVSPTKSVEIFDLQIVEKEEVYDATYFENEKIYYPYYSLLKDREKQLYVQIYNEILHYSDTFSPSIEISIQEVNNAIEAVFNDHPKFFYLDTSYSYRYNEKEQCLQILLSFNETIQDIENSLLLWNQNSQAIIEKAMLFTNDLEKEEYVYELLMEWIEYDQESNINQSAYSALVNHASVCAGYARAFQYIMMELGIPTYYVQGFANENHAWNIILLDGKYYNVDLTWDDSFHKKIYFNKNDFFFNKTHTREGLSIYLPSCIY